MDMTLNQDAVAEIWRPVVLTFESACSFDNPFLDVEIWAEFTGSSGRVIRREAYWDGGRTYCVSFAPTELGVWNYVIEAPEQTGLNGCMGRVEAVPYAGDLDLYRHGFIRVADNPHLFAYSDGTPFFWLGDTHWEFAYRESWDASNHPGMTSQFRGMVDLRAEQGFTVYQTNLRSDMGAGDRYWIDGGMAKGVEDVPNVAFYQRELDRRMAYIADAGLVNALGQAWAFAILGEHAVEHQKHLARYLVARYGAYPMVWTLAGEVAGYRKEGRAAMLDGWREVALEIEVRDGYGHLATAHYTNERPFADYYQDEPWMDFTLNQAGHGDYLIKTSDYFDYLAAHDDKPFVEGEALYEFCSTLEEMGTRLCTADMLRRVAYICMQAGGAGYTYGAQGIWGNVWESPEELDPFMAIFNRFGITWAQAVDGEGAVQMGYMRSFYEDNHFWELAPYETTDAGNLFANKAPLATANQDLSRIVAYFGDTVRQKLAIEGVPTGAAYASRWFNPRTGAYRDGEDALAVTGSIILPDKPGVGDWLLVLELKA